MSRKTTIVYAVAALLLLLAFVLARFPAATALSLLARHSAVVIPYQASGTVWQGEAQNLLVTAGNNTLDLGRTRWHIRPWALLAGRLLVDVDAINGEQKLRGQLQLGIGGKLQVQDVELAVDIERLAALYPMPFQLQGFVELQLQQAAIAGKTISALDGNIVVRDLLFRFSHPVPLGDYAARLKLVDGEIQATVSDIDGVITIAGMAAANLAERSYRSDLQLQPQAGADPAIEQTLRMLAQPQNGQYILRRSGNF
ncbi:MAG TPA: type II secretion system protein N [Pseudomonadales bacterium]